MRGFTVLHSGSMVCRFAGFLVPSFPNLIFRQPEISLYACKGLWVTMALESKTLIISVTEVIEFSEVFLWLPIPGVSK